jgi:hypothetical protein
MENSYRIKNGDFDISTKYRIGRKTCSSKFFKYREHLLAFLEQRAHNKTGSRIFSNGDSMGFVDIKGKDLELATAEIATSVA